MSLFRHPFEPEGRFPGAPRLIRHGLAGAIAYALFFGLSTGGHAQDKEALVDGVTLPLAASDGGSSGDSITSEKNEVRLQEDGTVADALQRRPDLRFGYVTVDGEKSRVSLSSMSAAAVETLEVLKAVTPDLDADSIGGSVHVKSRPAFEQKVRTFQGRLTYQVNPEIDDFDVEGTVTVGTAFGVEQQWGTLLTVRGERDTGGSDSRRIDWKDLDTPGGSIRVIDRLRLEQFRDRDREAEFTGVLDHRVNERLSLFLRGNYATESTLVYDPRFELRFGEGRYAEASDREADVDDARVRRRLMAFEGFEKIWSAAFGGFYTGEGIDVDFRLFSETNDYSEPDFFIIDFDQTGVDLSYDLSDRDFPAYQQTNGNSLYDATRFEFDEMVSEDFSRTSTDLIGTLNVKVKHGLGQPDTGFWKVGGKVQLRDVDQRADSRLYDGFDGDFRLSDVLAASTGGDLFDGRYPLDPLIGWPAAPDFRNAHIDQFVLNERRSHENSDPGTYDALEQIAAGYGMGAYEKGALRLLAGIRYEQTLISFTGREVNIDEDGRYESTRVRKGVRSYGNVFPGLHGRYHFGDRLALIGSWTETIDRPNYRDLVPYRYIDREYREVEEGNPDLKPARFTNFDLALDIGMPGSGLVSFEVFARKLQNFFYRQESIIPEGPFAGYRLERQENGPTASISGAELTWAQGLGVLHESLAPVAFNINYLWRRTSIIYPTRPEQSLPLAGLPEEEITLTFSYEKAWFYGQFEVTHESKSLVRLGDIPAQDTYSNGRTRLDFNSTYEIMAGVKLIAELRNITGEPARRHYKAVPEYPYYLRNSSWRATFGVRWDL